MLYVLLLSIFLIHRIWGPYPHTWLKIAALDLLEWWLIRLITKIHALSRLLASPLNCYYLFLHKAFSPPSPISHGLYLSSFLVVICLIFLYIPFTWFSVTPPITVGRSKILRVEIVSSLEQVLFQMVHWQPCHLDPVKIIFLYCYKKFYVDISWSHLLFSQK